MRIQRISSKWAKTEAILLNRSLAPYIPDTRKYDASALEEMLALYETVYIKPDRGTYGSGVMRAERRTTTLSSDAEKNTGEAKQEDNAASSILYILRYGTKAQAYRSLQELHQAVSARIQGRIYLIQRGIDLLRHKKHPFDLRVLVQQTPKGRWESTGMLGRVAAPQKIVTNYHSGGRVFPVKKLLAEHMDAVECSAMIQQLKNLGVQIGHQLQAVYPAMKEIGLDVALDARRDIWILEVNTLPSLVAFKMFENKSIYRRISRYAAAYGRSGFGTPAQPSGSKKPARVN